MPTEIQAYQHALSVWEDFHSRSKCPVLNEESLTRRAATENMLDRILRALPPVERTPTAIGLFVRTAKIWSAGRKSRFLEEFLPSPPPVVSNLLNAANRGEVRRPRNLPVTLEEFPSRIWNRALASKSPERLVGAAHLAFKTMVNLIEQHEDDTDLDDPAVFRIPSGVLPDLIDLAALSPIHLVDLKLRVIDQLEVEILTERFQMSKDDIPAITAWILVDTKESPGEIGKLSAEAEKTMENYLATHSLHGFHHTHRLGLLMFRFGLRRLASRCAKAIGDSPWHLGWQFQSISGMVHARIRKIILRPDSDTDAWMREPALACSAMSIPLWLADGVERVSTLVTLFNKAEECPWIFPRLQHIYQWHLALAGKHEELRQIEQLSPDLALGLSGKPAEA